MAETSLGKTSGLLEVASTGDDHTNECWLLMTPQGWEMLEPEWLLAESLVNLIYSNFNLKVICKFKCVPLDFN